MPPSYHLTMRTVQCTARPVQADRIDSYARKSSKRPARLSLSFVMALFTVSVSLVNQYYLRLLAVIYV